MTIELKGFKNWLSQQAITCSKLLIETVEKDQKCVQLKKKNTKTTSMTRYGVYFVNFEHISRVSNLNFEQLNVC